VAAVIGVEIFKIFGVTAGNPKPKLVWGRSLKIVNPPISGKNLTHFFLNTAVAHAWFMMSFPKPEEAFRTSSVLCKLNRSLKSAFRTSRVLCKLNRSLKSATSL